MSEAAPTRKRSPIQLNPGVTRQQLRVFGALNLLLVVVALLIRNNAALQSKSANDSVVLSH